MSSPTADFYSPSLAFLRSKWLIASTSSLTSVHMLANAYPTTGLTALATGATQAQCNALANSLQAAIVAHMAGVGTPSVNGEHLAADTGNSATLAAIPVASSSATCITLINGLAAACVAHGTQSGVHFTNDSVLNGLTLTVAPPVTLANQITDLNQILAALNVHLALGVKP